MLLPSRVKHRKQHRGKRRGLAYRGSTVAFGEFGSFWLSIRPTLGRARTPGRRPISATGLVHRHCGVAVGRRATMGARVPVAGEGHGPLPLSVTHKYACYASG